jgi:transposase
VGTVVQGAGCRRGQRICDDRFDDCESASAQRGSEEKKGAQAIGRSKGGLTTKIHATCDALGNPTGFTLTPGQAHDLAGADILLQQIEADIIIADKGYDADERVLEPIAGAGKIAVIAPKQNRKIQREYDKELYKARHLIENFFARIKQYRAIATRYDKTDENFLAAIYAAATITLLN